MLTQSTTWKTLELSLQEGPSSLTLSRLPEVKTLESLGHCRRLAPSCPTASDRRRPRPIR